MKKIILVFFLIIVNFTLFAEEKLSEFEFGLQFEKVAISDIHFEDIVSGDMISSTAFPLDEIDGGYTHSVDLVYHIYPGESVELIFVSSAANEGTYLNDGTMLTSISSDLGIAGIPLNYDVMLGSKSIVFDNDSGSSIPGRNEAVPISYRTLQVVSADGNEVEGRQTLTMNVNPPVDENGNEAFMAGQYTGYIIMRLYTIS